MSQMYPVVINSSQSLLPGRGVRPRSRIYSASVLLYLSRTPVFNFSLIYIESR